MKQAKPWLDLMNPVSKVALNTIYKRMSTVRSAIGPNIDIIIDVHAVLGQQLQFR